MGVLGGELAEREDLILEHRPGEIAVHCTGPRTTAAGRSSTNGDDHGKALVSEPPRLEPAVPSGEDLVVPEKMGALKRPGASVAEVRAYFDGLVSDLLSPEGRMGCLMVNSAMELAAEDSEVSKLVRGHMARFERNANHALIHRSRRRHSTDCRWLRGTLRRTAGSHSKERCRC